ncbi:MAG: hypothetical protein ACRDZX_03055 [Acidimicrobiales bacterium]
MFQEPELRVVKFPPPPEEEQAERDRQREGPRRRYRERVAAKLSDLGAPAGRPSGRFYRAWKGGDPDIDDEDSYELREDEEDDVVAEGSIVAEGYGSSPAERARFIVQTVRDHLRHQSCRRHAEGLPELASLLGREPAFCPSCGARLCRGVGELGR